MSRSDVHSFCAPAARRNAHVLCNTYSETLIPWHKVSDIRAIFDVTKANSDAGLKGG